MINDNYFQIFTVMEALSGFFQLESRSIFKAKGEKLHKRNCITIESQDVIFGMNPLLNATQGEYSNFRFLQLQCKYGAFHLAKAVFSHD